MLSVMNRFFDWGRDGTGAVLMTSLAWLNHFLTARRHFVLLNMLRLIALHVRQPLCSQQDRFAQASSPVLTAEPPFSPSIPFVSLTLKFRIRFPPQEPAVPASRGAEGVEGAQRGASRPEAPKPAAVRQRAAAGAQNRGLWVRAGLAAAGAGRDAVRIAPLHGARNLAVPQVRP